MNVCMSWHFFDVFCSHQLLIVKKVCNNLQRYSLKQEVVNKLKKVLFLILNKLWWGQQVWHLFILCVFVCVCAHLWFLDNGSSVCYMARFVLRLVAFSQQFRRKERATEQEHTQQRPRDQTQANYREKLFFTKKKKLCFKTMIVWKDIKHTIPAFSPSKRICFLKK